MYKYSAENHDWDLTLHSARELLQLGRAMERTQSKKGSLSQGFACFTGSMVLSFSAIESILASIAFKMRGNDFDAFNFEDFRKARAFWSRVDLVAAVLDIRIDKSTGLFKTIVEMQQWRNLVTHASPFEIQTTLITDTTNDPPRLHKRLRDKDYTRKATAQDATRFYGAAVEFVDLLIKASGVRPNAFASYEPVGDSTS